MFEVIESIPSWLFDDPLWYMGLAKEVPSLLSTTSLLPDKNALIVSSAMNLTGSVIQAVATIYAANV